MASQRLPPNTAADVVAGGTVAWTNANNLKGGPGGDDDTYASVTLTNGQVSHYISATNFGFSIPAGAVINGVFCEIDAHSTAASPGVALVAQLVNGTLIGNSNPNTFIMADGENNSQGVGGFPNDLWNYPLTPTIINASTFGIAFIVTNNTGSNLTAYIDWLDLTVTYDVPGGLVYTPRNMGTGAWWLKR